MGMGAFMDALTFDTAHSRGLSAQPGVPDFLVAIDTLSKAAGTEPGLGRFQLAKFAHIPQQFRIVEVDDLICHGRIPAVQVPARKRAGGFVARARGTCANFVGQCHAAAFDDVFQFIPLLPGQRQR
jgi:hypothetical protein